MKIMLANVVLKKPTSFKTWLYFAISIKYFSIHFLSDIISWAILQYTFLERYIFGDKHANNITGYKTPQVIKLHRVRYAVQISSG